MKTIIFLHTTLTGSSRDAIKTAKKLGYHTVLLTKSGIALKRRKSFTEVHRMIKVNLSKIEEVKNSIENLRSEGLTIEGIVSFVDPFVSLAAELHKEYCNKSLSIGAMRAMEDKTLTREKLKDLPYTPKFYKVKGSEFKQSIPSSLKPFTYPLVVKSPLSTGSKDVLKVENDQELLESVKLLVSKNPTILIEEYLDGPQYLVETVVVNGEIHIIAIFQQEVDHLKRFIVTGYSLMNEIESDLYKNIEEAVKNIITAFEMETGACHLEIRIVNDQVKLIEINPRISGSAMNRMIKIAYGINLVEETLKLYLGSTPDLSKKWEKHLFTQYVTVSTSGTLVKITGRKSASRSQGVVEVTLRTRKGRFLFTPKSMGHRYAYVIATGDTSDQAKKNAKTAAKKIKFHLSS
ncbi:ATP-grasp domain-containing protein [Ureibacillus sp. NPDC094379]